MTQPTRSLQLAGYVLLVAAEFLSFDDVDTLTWTATPDNLTLTLTLNGDDVIAVNTGDVGSAGLGAALQAVFEQLQQELPETSSFWGQPLPACQAGHAHAASCEQQTDGIWVVCPTEGSKLRRMLTLPDASFA